MSSKIAGPGFDVLSVGLQGEQIVVSLELPEDELAEPLEDVKGGTWPELEDSEKLDDDMSYLVVVGCWKCLVKCDA